MKFLIFIGAKFPVDRAFELEKRKRERVSTKISFWMMMTIIFGSAFYISIVVLWLLLGAIINPNFFLVYTTSVITLITFVTTKK